nr:MAG TPA: hypothetical protein [Bacteriophage sp.]
MCNLCVISARGSGFWPSKSEPKSSFSESSIHWESKKNPATITVARFSFWRRRRDLNPPKKSIYPLQL